MIYKECKDCIAKPFCKRYAGGAPAPEQADWCSVKYRLDKALSLSQIPAEYLTANIYGYTIDQNNEQVFAKVRKYIDNIVAEVDGGLNLFFYSNNFGTGKTYHAAMVLNHYIYKTCLTSRFDFEHPLALFAVYADVMDAVRYRDDGSDLVAYVKGVPLLLLDDVGAGTMSDFTREQTYLILNHRFNNRLSTVITTNYDLKELASGNILGERNVSRITSRCDGALIGGPDRRRVRRK